MAKRILCPWTRTLGAHPAVPIPDGSAGYGSFDCPTDEVAFWLWRVNKVRIQVNLLLDGTDVVTLDQTYYKGHYPPGDQFTTEDEMVLDGYGWVVGDGPMGWSFMPGSIPSASPYRIHLINNNPREWRIWHSMSIADERPDATDVLTSVSTDETQVAGVDLTLEGTDLVSNITYSRVVAMYQNLGSTVTWSGSITITPSTWFSWDGLYSTSTGDYI